MAFASPNKILGFVCIFPKSCYAGPLGDKVRGQKVSVEFVNFSLKRV